MTRISSPFVSIIMPVYNSEKYVEHAVNSICTQSFDDFELLLVDDGSSDSSGSICDSLAKADKRIRVFHKDNGGMCSARNYGIQHAAGEYIGFCDNDDEFLPNLLKDNCEIALNERPDVIRFGRRLVMKGTSSGGDLTSELTPSKKAVYRGEQVFTNYSETRKSVAVWNALYKRETIVANRITFDERLRHGLEDAIFNVDVLSVAESVACNPNVYYVWTRRLGHSASFNITPDFLLGTKIAAYKDYSLMIRESVDKKSPETFAATIVRYLMDPLEATLLSNTMTYKGTLPLMKELSGIFSRYRGEVLSCPLPIAKDLFFRTITSGRYRTAYLAMRISRIYLKHKAS